LYSDAPQLHNAGTHLISTDEKTSIQALERVAPTKPMISGHPEKIEFEYRRHGTLSLIPSFEVATGKIVRHHIGETRNEQDFAGHIAATIGDRREDRWIFISDQLNTHMSETLVRMVAELTGHKGDLGEKMEMFIDYFNRTMAKPYKWTYKGLPLTA
jgi:hypothetical protein